MTRFKMLVLVVLLAGFTAPLLAEEAATIPTKGTAVQTTPAAPKVAKAGKKHKGPKKPKASRTTETEKPLATGVKQ